MVYQLLVGIIQVIEALYKHFSPRAVVARPAIEPSYYVEVGEAVSLVKALDTCLVYALYHKAAGAHVVMANEIGKHAVANAKAQLLSLSLGYDKGILLSGRVGELRQFAVYEALAKEPGVVFRSYALEHHPKEIVVGFEYALCQCEALNMAYTLNAANGLLHRIVDTYGKGLACVHRLEVHYLYVAAKAGHLVPYGMLEAQHHGHGDNHYRQADGYAKRCYPYGRAANLGFPCAVCAIYSASYVER